MDFYTAISDYYDQIFPYNPAQLKFVLKNIEDVKGKRLLDIGCGTGSLSINLSQMGFDEIQALDFDPKMIEKAKEKIERKDDSLVFQEMDMRKVSKIFNANSFDAVICFGNTLPHLLQNEEIDRFIQSVAAIIKTSGRLMIQILNYNHILKDKIDQLPILENEKILFERSYNFRADRLIDFKTKLTIRESGQTIDNTIQLNPLVEEELISILKKHHFTNIKLYGDFMMNPLKADSLPLVLCATKDSL